MIPINKYPYTDVHELNMDWVLNELRRLVSEWVEMKSEWTDLESEFESLKSYVENYFNNLNLTNEVNAKLNQMSVDGTLSALIAPLLMNAISPKFVASTSDMTDTSALYVLAGTGYLYYYDSATNQFVSSNVRYGDVAAVNQLMSDSYISLPDDPANWIPQGTLTSGYYVSTNGSSYANAAWSNIQWAVSPGDNFKITTYCVPVAPAMLFFDSSNTVLSFLPDPVNPSGEHVDITFIVPANAVKMVMNFSGVTPTCYKLTTSDKFKTDIQNPLHGKSFIALGDSITYGSGIVPNIDKVWGSLIATRNEMSFTNAGVSGSTMGDGVPANACWSTGRYAAVQGKDYAIIWFGWNDYYFSQLGTPDITDPTTFLGAYYNTLYWIIRNSPKTKVGVIIPYLWTYNVDPQGYTIMQLINGLKTVCDLNGIPYLDINKYNFLESWGSDYPNDAQYYTRWDAKQQALTADTLHPNVEGNKYLSTIIEAFMRSL